MLDTAVLHTGDVIQGRCFDTNSERWNTGGLGAWRCLVLHHEPTSLTRIALQELLNFSFEGEMAARMAQFDRDIKRAARRS